MNIHAKSIRYFDAISRSRSIREAARRLHVDASAVNRQLLNLEEEIGAALFERLPGKLRLTQAGEIFSQHVITVLQDEQRALAELEKLRGVERGNIRVVAVEGLNTDFLPIVLERMLRRYPNVHIQTNTMGSTSIANQVLAGDADLGVAFELLHDAELKRVGEVCLSLGAIMAPSHPMAGCLHVTFAECASYPLIMANPDLALHDLLAPLMSKMNSPVIPVIHTSSVELMRQLAMRGLGVAFQTRLGLSSLCASGQLVYVPLREPAAVYAELGLYVRSARVLPPAITALVTVMNQELAQLQQEDMPKA